MSDETRAPAAPLRRRRALSMAGLLALGLSLGACGTEPDDEPFTTPAQEDLNQSSSAGDYAQDFLTDDTYAKIYIEIDYMSSADASFGPAPQAIDSLIAHLNLFCSKTDIIYNPEDSNVIPIPENTDGSLKEDYTYGELNALEKQYRDRYRSGDTAVLYFLYVNGQYVTDAGEATSAIGFAHHGSSMVILKGIVNNAAPVARTFYEKSVIVHEAGHLLGLVTTGIPAVNAEHVDPDPRAAGAHCIFTNCMMHWAIGPDDLLAAFLSGQDAEFDQCCRDDIAAAGGKSTTASGAQTCEPADAKTHGEHPADFDPQRAAHILDPAHPNVLF